MMIQDIGSYRLDNSFRNEVPDEHSYVLCFVNGDINVRYIEDKRMLEYPLWNKENDLVYVFSIDDEKYFLSLKDEKLNGFDLYSMRDLRALDLRENKDIFIAYTAYHLYHWYTTSVYCGKCGHKLVHSENERAMVCKECGNVIYPRINPAVIIGVKNKDRLLLTKYREGYANYALVAGFTEFGETLEETVQREVMEETGLKVKNITYYKSQPWGIASDILAGFYCEVDGDDTIRMDENELKYAQWVKREDIILQPKPYSLTNEMMDRFKRGLEK